MGHASLPDVPHVDVSFTFLTLRLWLRRLLQDLEKLELSVMDSPGVSYAANNDTCAKVGGARRNPRRPHAPVLRFA